jgi:phosphatidylglycerol:prolipoprotein diacylglycerol transferase
LIAGLVGAKAWYMVLKGPSRQTLKEGWSVDGFLVVAPATAVLFAAAQGLAIGAYLDGVTPGIFMAVAIGRVGCFLTGCCAGRPTAGWGIWSSDRRVGARRIPAQLLESAIGLALASLSSALLVGGLLGGTGLVFVITVAVYMVSRQGLLRLRAEARPFSWRRAMRPAPTHR